MLRRSPRLTRSTTLAAERWTISRRCKRRSEILYRDGSPTGLRSRSQCAITDLIGSHMESEKHTVNINQQCSYDLITASGTVEKCNHYDN